MAKRKNKKAKKIILSVVGVLIVAAIVVAGLNFLAVENLIKKGASYAPVEYDEPVVLVTDEDGEKYFLSDRGL